MTLRTQHTRLPCPSLSPGVCPIHVHESMMLSNHLILCHPLILLPSIFSSIKVFSSESALWIRWPKYWSFSFSTSPSTHSSVLAWKIRGTAEPGGLPSMGSHRVGHDWSDSSSSMSIDLVMLFNHLILCRPLLLLPLIFPSIKVFSNELALCIRWLKYWSFSFSASPSHEYSGLISFRVVWFDLLAVQRTLKSLFQQHNSKASILQHSAFFMVQF